MVKTQDYLGKLAIWTETMEYFREMENYLYGILVSNYQF